MAEKNEDSDSNADSIEGDPAEFLLNNSKYHDCYLTIGNPEIDEVEKIGVSSIHLIAHSSVFRDMLADSELADASGSNTHIIDVSPATFKLMLTHIYGGKLPNLTPEEAKNLALCADKYIIQRLVSKATKRLKPTSADDIFPALMCAAYIDCPDLEHQVSTIIQRDMDKIIQNATFLQLDENCLLFIAKQSVLNISELELWNSLVRWGESRVEKHPEKTLRDCLHKFLPYIRLVSLGLEEITKQVLPKKILTSDEFVDLTLAVTNNQTIQSPGLCKVRERRWVFEGISDKKDTVKTDAVKPAVLFTVECVWKPPMCYTLKQKDCKPFSTVTMKPSSRIEINSFTIQGIKSDPGNDVSFNEFFLICSVTVNASSEGLLKNVESLTLCGTAVPNEKISLPVKKRNGQPLILEANETYNFKFNMSPSLPVHTLLNCYSRSLWFFTEDEHVKLQFENPFHLLEFNYRV